MSGGRRTGAARHLVAAAIAVGVLVHGAALHAIDAAAQDTDPMPAAEGDERRPIREIPPLETPGLDPVLDAVDVERTDDIEEAEERIVSATEERAMAYLRWLDAERARLDLLARVAEAASAVEAARGRLAALAAELALERDELGRLRLVEADRLAALDEQRAELRALAAAVFASAPNDRYAFFGTYGDLSASARREAVKERGVEQQSARVEAVKEPWEDARADREGQQDRVEEVAVAMAEAAAALDRALEARDRSDELLAAQAATTAGALDALDAADERGRYALAALRSARMESTVEGLDMPLVALHAYWRTAGESPCQIPWWVLAGIGRVETRHGSAQRSALEPTGDTTVPIRGIPLDGRPGVAAVRDTDGGLLDGDRVWDRAVGPMQFIPSTWARWSADGNADEVPNPHNIYDAAAAASNYLCYNRPLLDDEDALRAALLSYNRSIPYGQQVMARGAEYRDALELPDRPDPDPNGDAVED